jgi:hypothetical protein
MAIVNEWELRGHITAALDTLHADLESDNREERITGAVNLLDNCIRLLEIMVQIEEADPHEEDDDHD